MAANTGKPWTEIEDATLRRLWGKASDAKIAKELKRTEKDLIDRAGEIGLPPCVARNVGFRWTPESDSRLRLMWGESGEGAMRASLGRTVAGIINRAWELSLPQQSQGMETINSCEKRLGVQYTAILRYLADVGVTPSRRSPVTIPSKAHRHAVVEPAVAETVVTQRDARVGSPSRYSSDLGMYKRFAWNRMVSAGIAPSDTVKKSRKDVPVGLLEEVCSGIDGPWTAVWRAVLAEGEFPFARWFIALAVYDTLHVEKADREWIEIVATQKAQKIIDSIVAKLGAKMPGVVRAVDSKAEKKGRAA